MKLYCCGCEKIVKPRLTRGKEIYPHRKDLYDLPFWICDTCRNYVGCHYKTKHETKPLGNIPTPKIRLVRKKIHSTLDDIWKSGRVKRGRIYARISADLGYPFHSGEIKTIGEAIKVLGILERIDDETWRHD